MGSILSLLRHQHRVQRRVRYRPSCTDVSVFAWLLKKNPLMEHIDGISQERLWSACPRVKTAL